MTKNPSLRSVPAFPCPSLSTPSNGLLFELYDGGQPFRCHQIVWERLKTTETQSPTGPASAASANSIRD